MLALSSVISPFIYFPVMLPADHLPCSRGWKGGHAPALSNSPDSQAKHAVHSILGDTMACYVFRLFVRCLFRFVSLFTAFLLAPLDDFLILSPRHASIYHPSCMQEGP